MTSKNNITRKTRGRIVKGIIQDLKDIKPAFDPGTALKLMKEKEKFDLRSSEALTYKNEKNELIIYVDTDGKARLLISCLFLLISHRAASRPGRIISLTPKQGTS